MGQSPAPTALAAFGSSHPGYATPAPYNVTSPSPTAYHGGVAAPAGYHGGVAAPAAASPSSHPGFGHSGGAATPGDRRASPWTGTADPSVTPHSGAPGWGTGSPAPSGGAAKVYEWPARAN